MVGLPYRRFYKNTRPHTKYSSQIWNSPLQKDIDQLERVQKFALNMCAKQWDLGYTELPQ